METLVNCSVSKKGLFPFTATYASPLKEGTLFRSNLSRLSVAMYSVLSVEEERRPTEFASLANVASSESALLEISISDADISLVCGTLSMESFVFVEFPEKTYRRSRTIMATSCAFFSSFSSFLLFSLRIYLHRYFFV